MSLGLAKDDGADRDYDKYWDEDILTVDGERYHFGRRDRSSRTYSCDFTKLACINVNAADEETMREHVVPVFETEEDVARVYTERERKLAAEAKELFARMAYPSIKGLINLLRKGKIRNCDVTPRDVLNCVRIHGVDLAAVRGRTTRMPRPAVRSQPSAVPMIGDEDIDLFVDIMFVNRVMFLVTVGSPMRYIMVTHLPSKRAGAIKSALQKHIAKYVRQGFTVKALFSDGESGIGAIVPDLEIQKIDVQTAGPETHVGKVEVAIRYLKQMARSIVSTLPYKLSQSMIVWLVYHCASRSNFVPISTLNETITPREYLLGRQLDMKLDLQLKFGEHVEVHMKGDNSPMQRTRPGIALVSVGNLYGSWKVLMLDTMKIATMDSWTARPMSSVVINVMNSLAASKGLKPLQDELDFTLVNDRSVGDMSGEELEELMLSPEARKEREIVSSTEPDFEVEETAGADTNVVGPSNLVDDRGGDAEPLTAGEVMESEEAQLFDEQLVDPDSPQHADDSGDLGEVHMEPEPETVPTVEGVRPLEPSRYGLRSARRYGHLDGRWEEREPSQLKESEVRIERGFRISVKAGIKRFGKRAIEAIHKELSSIHGKDVFEPVKLDGLSMTQKKRIIRAFIFLKEKFLPDGKFDKLKARLVAGGHLQDKSLYADEEINSPTAALQSVFMVATLAALEKRNVMTMDVGSAYLNADMERDVYMMLEPEIARVLCEIDPSVMQFLNSNGSVLVKLRKALYGCVESAKLWYLNISSKLIKLGFKPNPKDECVLNMDYNGKQLTVCLYVDDLLCTCEFAEALEWLKDELVKEYKDVNSNVGPVHSYLGMTFDWQVESKVKVTMSGYIKDMLALYEVEGTRVTPALQDLFEVDANSARLDAALSESFASRVAKVLYLAKRVRPDILLTVNFLASRAREPTEQDWAKLARLLQYINATSEMGMVLEATKSIQLLAYVDASFAVHSDFKSHTGGILSLGAGPVFTKSKKQKLNTVSSTEAELVGISDMLPQALWSRDWLLAQGYEVGPLKLFQDNTSTIHLSNNGPSNKERTRHIAIRYYWIKDRVVAREVEIAHLGTADMIADFLSKPLQGELFRGLRKLLLNWD